MIKEFIVAACKPWHITQYWKDLREFRDHGKIFHTRLVETPDELNECLELGTIRPRYIFFPHWSWIVPDEIINAFECVCFHETPLPYGRGGSPIQNMIERDHEETVITAFRMEHELDAGPIYMAEHLCLNGSAEEIYLRSAETMKRMMIKIMTEKSRGFIPQNQTYRETVCFKRRTPEESEILPDREAAQSLKWAYNHIRMLDAPTYPKAFLVHGGLRYTFDSAIMRMDGIHAHVIITPRSQEEKK